MLKNPVVLVAAVAAIGLLQLVAAGPEVSVPRDFKEMLVLANKLESTEMMPANRRDGLNKQHRDLLYAFNRESKRAHCERHYQQALEKMDEFRLKGLQYVEEVNRGNKNWLGGMFGTLGNMRGIARFDSFLEDLVKKYVDAKKGLFSSETIECDMIKFRIKILHSIMFLLSTEIKHLVTGEQQVLNQAIMDQLKADRMASKVNYYDVHKLNTAQQALLFQFFVDHTNIEETRVAETVDHSYQPGQYITGRLLDACQSVLRFDEEWVHHERLQQEGNVCKKAKMSKGFGITDLSLFMKLHRQDKYDDVFHFCRAFFDAL